MVKQSEAIQGTEKEFLNEFHKLCYSRSSWQVWADLMTAIACSISNVADRSPEHYESREKEYAQCIERLGSVEIPAKMLAIIVEALERNPEQDFLGEMYMQLNLGNHWKGQFFTPYCVCKMMSEITCEDVDSHIEKQGYLSGLQQHLIICRILEYLNISGMDAKANTFHWYLSGLQLIRRRLRNSLKLIAKKMMNLCGMLSEDFRIKSKLHDWRKNTEKCLHRLI